MKKIYECRSISGSRCLFTSLQRMMKWAGDNWMDAAENAVHYNYFLTIRPNPFIMFEDGRWAVFESPVNDPSGKSRQISVEELRKAYDKHCKTM